MAGALTVFVVLYLAGSSLNKRHRTFLLNIRLRKIRAIMQEIQVEMGNRLLPVMRAVLHDFEDCFIKPGVE